MYGVIKLKYGYPEYESVPGSTFDELYSYVKANKDVYRVVIPHTYYGYGSSLIDQANSEWLERHYPRAIKSVCYNVTISRWKFLDASGEELREIIQGLAEDYPLIDDDTHSRLEAETIAESFNDWAASEIDPDMSPSQILDVLEWHGMGLWDVLQLDTDGITVYMPRDMQATVQQLISELSANQ